MIQRNAHAIASLFEDMTKSVAIIYINIKFVVSHVFSPSLSSRFARTLYRTLCVGCYPYTQIMLHLLQWQVEDFHDRGTNSQGGGGGCQPIGQIFPKTA